MHKNSRELAPQDSCKYVRKAKIAVFSCDCILENTFKCCQWTILIWFKYNLGYRTYYTPQFRPDRGSNSSWPTDHDSTFHVTETPALTTRPSGTFFLQIDLSACIKHSIRSYSWRRARPLGNITYTLLLYSLYPSTSNQSMGLTQWGIFAW